MRKLLDIDKTNLQLLEAGISPGLFPVSGFLWNDCGNVVFRDGGPKTMEGWTVLIAVGKDIRQLGQQFIPSAGVNGRRRAYMGTPVELLAYTLANGLVSIGGGYNSTGIWTFTNWGEWLVAVNGVDPVQVWKNNYAVQAIDVDTTPFFDTCKIVKQFKNQLLAFNATIVDGGTTVWWSGIDDIDEWDPLADPTAGSLFIRDLESDIVAVSNLADRLAIYTNDSMSLLTWLGFPLNFGVEKTLQSIGAWGVNSVAEVDRRNFGWGRGGLWVTDGFSVEYIDEPAIRHHWKDTLNRDEAEKIVCFHDEEAQQVVWYYPSKPATENDVGLGFDYRRNTWTKYDFGRTAAVPRRIWNYPLTADTNVYNQGQGNDAGGDDLVAWVQSLPLDLGASERYKRIQQVKLLLDKIQGDVTLELGVQDDLEASIEWIHSSTATIENVIADREALYWILKLSSTGAEWRLSGFRMDGEPGGLLR